MRVRLLLFVLFVCSLALWGQEHAFVGKWITDAEMVAKVPRPFKARQLQRHTLPPVDKSIQNRHILFRKTFELDKASDAKIFITADDYYKLYVNGKFVGQGPAAGLPEHTYYNEYDVAKFLRPGRNVVAVHTYYQGLVNRVWVSGDNRHGLIMDLVADGRVVVASDASFRTASHRAFSSMGISGYETQFLERYDAAAPEVGFARLEFDDSAWSAAVPHPRGGDYRLFRQPTPSVVNEEIAPVRCERRANDVLQIDFGGIYVGGLRFAAKGPKGAEIVLRCAQELNPDGSVRSNLRCCCKYEEAFRLSGGLRDVLDQYDYKSFRHVELKIPAGVTVDPESIRLVARHLPFELKAKPNFTDARLEPVWKLCVDSFHYGVQEQIMDCMDREKGYYLGDGVYTMYTYCLLTKDWTPARRFFDDFLRTREIDRGLVTCANCAYMQEIAEYPLMLFLFARMYLDETGDAAFLDARYDAFADILDSYRERYARADGLLVNLDKWCVVEWPAPYRDGYDADITEGRVCTQMHNVINAWYIGAIKCLNEIAQRTGRAPYADTTSLEAAFVRFFWDSERNLFRDREGSSHISMPANIFATFFGLEPPAARAAHKDKFLEMVRAKRFTTINFFQFPPLFMYLAKEGEMDLLHELLVSPDAWLRMLREDATRTFEGWGKDTKWNTSLFHLTMAAGAMFLTDNAVLVPRREQ